MPEFDQDWTMLQHISVETDTVLVRTSAPVGGTTAGYR
jgi:hypothetical protein